MAYVCVIFLLLHFLAVYKSYLREIKKTRWPLSFALKKIDKLFIPVFNKEQEAEFLKNLSDEKETVCVCVKSDGTSNNLMEIYFWSIPVLFIIFFFSIEKPTTIDGIISGSIVMYLIGTIVNCFLGVYVVNIAYKVANPSSDRAVNSLSTKKLLQEGANALAEHYEKLGKQKMQ